MDNYIGKIGVIEEYNIIFDSYRVKFENGMSYHYPAERIEHHLVDEEPTIEVDYNNVSVRICEDNSLIGYYTDDCGITSFGKTFDELLRNLQHAKKAIEESRERLAKEDLEEVKIKANKGVDISFESKSSNDLKSESLNESCIDYGKIEQGYICPQTKQQCDDECCVSAENCHLKTSVALEKPEKTNPLDDLPIIGDGVLMEVSDDMEIWYKRFVFAKYGNYFLAHDGVEDIRDVSYNISPKSWIHARPITKTKITRKEFESKFEIID